MTDRQFEKLLDEVAGERAEDVTLQPGPRFTENSHGALRGQASRASSKNYSSIRYQMEQLRDCCSEAESFVSELAQEFKTEYKRRPAFMAELKRL